jgi:hypothetical protein
MNEDNRDAAGTALENRSRALFHDSVDGVNMAVRSRLTQARYAALEASAVSRRRPWFLRGPVWTPAAGVVAAALVGVALWFGTPGNGAPGVQSNLEVLDMVASSDGSGDALEMLQDDIDFYDFADKAAGSEPPA